MAETLDIERWPSIDVNALASHTLEVMRPEHTILGRIIPTTAGQPVG
jgi:hypothetical protein